jgi:hypothetical protein
VWAALTLAGCALGSSTSVAAPAGDIPLPQNSSAPQRGQSATSGGQDWIYTVANTTARDIEGFYKAALPQDGWTGYDAAFATANGGESVTITAQKVGKKLEITAGPGQVQNVTAPSGGVSLDISVTPLGV